MKKLLYGIVICSSVLLTACAQTRNIGEGYTDEPLTSISYQQFYDDLSPYGQWIDNPEFGYVWVPHLSGFRPYYSNGYWAYTNFGWTWVSNYNWGWAPFHYGSWFYDDFYGWSWVPGYEWAPAWVNWRSSSQYYGWAPQCPRRRDGRYYEIRNDQWAFVPHQYIARRNINNYYVSQQNNTTIINNTAEIRKVRVINRNVKYEEGPSVAEVEKVTNTKIRPLAVKQSPVAGDTKLQNGELRIFKPAVKENNIAAGKNENIKPSKVIEGRNVSPTSAQPVNETPQVNNTKAVPSDNKVTRKPEVNNPVTNNPVTNNNDKSSTPVNKETRQSPKQQDQTDVPNVSKIRPINNNNKQEQVAQEDRARQIQENRAQQMQEENQRRQQIQQQNKANNNEPEKRPVVAPRQSTPRESKQPKIRAEQQQNPSFNQRPVRERPASDFERRPQTVPNNSIEAPRRFNRPAVR